MVSPQKPAANGAHTPKSLDTRIAEHDSGRQKSATVSTEAAVSEIKIAVVDMERVFAAYNRVKMDENVASRHALIEATNEILSGQTGARDYDFIFNQSATGTKGVPAMLFARDATDLTSYLIERMTEE